MFESIVGALALIIVGTVIGSARVVEQGDQALVQRLGRYKRTLQPGLNFVVPFFDTVLVETVREQVLDIEPQNALTKDNVPVQLDAVVFWQIFDLRKAYYAVEDLEESLKQRVLTGLRSEIGQKTLQEAISSTDKINQGLLRELDKATANWGVKVIRVDLQSINLPAEIRQSLEREQAARSDKQATLLRNQATVESIQQLAQALGEKANSQDVLRYLIAREYVTANLEVSKSDNSKIVFMDPKALNEAVTELIHPSEFTSDTSSPHGNGSPN